MSTSTKFNSQLEVTQTVTLGGTLSVTGTATFNEQVAIVATNDRVSIVATGVAITASTTITGAVGISGASGEEDEFCAMFGALGGNPNIKISPDKDSCTTKTNGVSIKEGKII